MGIMYAPLSPENLTPSWQLPNSSTQKSSQNILAL